MHDHPRMPFAMGQPPEAGPFDVDEASHVIGEAIFGMLTMAMRSMPPTPGEARQWMAQVRHAILVGSRACAEVTRMRDELTKLRDRHRPQPHADPDRPGAQCVACSVHGALVAWPCETWQAAERILTHGKA